jgi:hypothetical protein
MEFLVMHKKASWHMEIHANCDRKMLIFKRKGWLRG